MTEPLFINNLMSAEHRAWLFINDNNPPSELHHPIYRVAFALELANVDNDETNRGRIRNYIEAATGICLPKPGSDALTEILQSAENLKHLPSFKDVVASLLVKSIVGSTQIAPAPSNAAAARSAIDGKPDAPRPDDHVQPHTPMH